MTDPIVASVNDQTLTRGQAEQISRHILASQGIPPQMVEQYVQQAGEQLEKQAIEHWITQTLVRAEAEKRAEPIAEEIVQGALEQIGSGLPDGMTLEQAVVSQGGSMDELRANIVTNERIRLLYEDITAKAEPVTNDEVSTFYADNKDKYTKPETVAARHILIRCEEHASEETHETAQAQAAEVRDLLVGGADFAELARDKSSCPSRNNGGDLGTIPRGQTVPEFEQAAFSQPVDEIGPVVKTPFGYHVIQVTAKQEAGMVPEDQATQHARELLEQQSRDKCFAEFVTSLREAATIEYGDPTGGIIIP